MADRDPFDAPDEEDRCIVCQAAGPVVSEPPLALRIVRALLLQVVPLPPEWLASRRRTCRVCGHQWTSGEEGPPPPPT